MINDRPFKLTPEDIIHCLGFDNIVIFTNFNEYYSSIGGHHSAGCAMENTSEMAVFVRVVEAGNFSAAVREPRLTPSAVSKLIGRLEARTTPGWIEGPY